MVRSVFEAVSLALLVVPFHLILLCEEEMKQVLSVGFTVLCQVSKLQAWDIEMCLRDITVQAVATKQP